MTSRTMDLNDLDLIDNRLRDAFQSILTQIKSERNKTPRVGIVCGSGLSSLTDYIKDHELISYDKISGWPRLKNNRTSITKGHETRGLVFGRLGESQVICQSGRLHFYEGYSTLDVTFAVRLFKLFNCEAVILTNAAGAVNPNVTVGRILAIYDHVSLPSLTSLNPLIGPNSDNIGPRFTPLSDAYDFELRKSVFRSLRDVAELNSVDVKEGIYAWVTGPTYETKAEGRFIRSMGADVVGMSTVPEVIAARHLGLRVLVLSLVTNIVIDTPYRSAEDFVRLEVQQKKATEPSVLKDLSNNPEMKISSIEPTWAEETANHEEVLEEGNKRAADMLRIVNYVVNDEIWRK
ncbi:nucleoside phosphorylase domain-containing protein [Phakopsora pachyrhizi]|uniref:purine-nucleoside phosphorylase n=1 Tax=Phakopsora pachyrhizi TaxID=170000 RepID=A0AAV0BWY8_PHAPC|nr:nucleoside phosphorylase domain-containing protein [Phakopsora pachyrhizi]CAH7690837.1 nucleoside phosphorylase domain-containing protein [Phakopsora pachyrhizi]